MTPFSGSYPSFEPVHPTRLAVVVEDEPSLRQMLMRSLQQIGCATQGFSSGETAIAWLEKNRAPDIVSLDLVLPWMCGLRVCEWVRTNPRTRRVPIMIVTGRTDVPDAAAAIEAGADVFLEKPFKMRTYLDEVRRLLSQSSVEHQLAAP